MDAKKEAFFHNFVPCYDEKLISTLHQSLQIHYHLNLSIPITHKSKTKHSEIHIISEVDPKSYYIYVPKRKNGTPKCPKIK